MIVFAHEEASLKSTAQIGCDGKCGASLRLTVIKPDEAMAEAKKQGWVDRDGRHLCPHCAAGGPLPMTYPGI